MIDTKRDDNKYNNICYAHINDHINSQTTNATT